MNARQDLRGDFEPAGAAEEPCLRVPKLKAQDLGIISFYVEDPKNFYLQIWMDEQAVPVGETCFRTLLFGPADEVEKVELPNERNVRFRSHADHLRGADAYAFMLRMISGLESKREGDSHIASQFKASWTRFQQKNPEKAASMESIVQNLIADSRLIVSHFAKDITTQNIQNAAKILNGHKGGQRAIIIGNGTEEKASPVTISLARILSTPGKTSVSEIGVVHPDAAVRARILEEFEALRHDEKLDSGLMLRDITPSDLEAAFEDYDRVYCDLPMGQDEVFDSLLIEAWSGRERQDNRFAHLRGAIDLQGTSSPLFKAAEPRLANYFSPETVMGKNAQIGESNKRLRTRCAAMVEHMTKQRTEGNNVRLGEMLSLGLIDGLSPPQMTLRK